MKFEKFRRKLEDAVTVAINSGMRVTATGQHGRYCPVGCLPGALAAGRNTPSTPTGDGLTKSQHDDFVQAFDNGIKRPSKYSKLGLLYRARFP